MVSPLLRLAPALSCHSLVPPSSAQFGGGGGFGFGAFGGGGLNELLRGFGQEMDDDERFGVSPDRYQEHFRAYSMATLPGRERLNVSYGGKSELRACVVYKEYVTDAARIAQSSCPLRPWGN